MPGDEMEPVGEQEGGGWDVDEELELPPDLVSRQSLLVFYLGAFVQIVVVTVYSECCCSSVASVHKVTDVC